MKNNERISKIFKRSLGIGDMEINLLLEIIDEINEIDSYLIDLIKEKLRSEEFIENRSFDIVEGLYSKILLDFKEEIYELCEEFDIQDSDILDSITVYGNSLDVSFEFENSEIRKKVQLFLDNLANTLYYQEFYELYYFVINKINKEL